MPQHVQISPEEDLETFYAVPPYIPVSSPAPAAALTPAGANHPVARDGAPPPTSLPPSPLIAAVLSLLLPGAGEIYVGQMTKGIVLVVLGIPTLGCCGLLSIVLAVDSYLLAERRRRGELIGDWQFF